MRAKGHNALPATVGFVKEVRSELKSEIRSVAARLDSMDAKWESKFQEILAVSHRTQAIVEEQRGENRIVLDGLRTMIERQDRIELEVHNIHHIVRDLSTPRP